MNSESGANSGRVTIKILLSLIVAVALVAAGCGDDEGDEVAVEILDDDEAEETTTAPAEETTTAPAEDTTTAPAEDATTAPAGEGGSQEEICAAADELEASIDAIDGDTVEEFQTTYDAAKEDFEALREVAGDQYGPELDNFEEAMIEFENSLADADEGGVLDAIFELAEGVAELAAAGDALDDAIDCPG